MNIFICINKNFKTANVSTLPKVIYVYLYIYVDTYECLFFIYVFLYSYIDLYVYVQM
jgi:hypothetical protein